MKAAFNVSVGLDITTVMNVAQAELLSNLILDVTRDPEILQRLKDASEDYDSGMPKSLFSMAEKLQYQVKTVQEYRANVRQKRMEDNAA